MRNATAIVLLCALASASHADSFRERLNAANALLRGGDVQAALDGYRDLRVDDPESPELLYNMGCAKYEEALRNLQDGMEDASTNPFEEARASFEKAQALGAGDLREDAAFNKANCLAQFAKHMSPESVEQDALIDAYQQSITAYEDLLRQYPDHTGARKNLDHMRYLLKKMLQNPPPPPEENQGKGENEPQEEQKQEEQPPDPSAEQQPGEQEQPQQAQQDSESEDEAQQQEQPEPEEAEENQDREEQMQNAAEPDTQEEEEQREAQAVETGDLPDRQTIEALLQSLEDRDQMEQQSERREPRQTRIRREWW
ncbi:MAG: hypothetical protein KJ060_04430 [Candidatus Hydrogenedentes bacterium]|nr:hypothetical protein [Candidatus Hydrogenedentota bacterium]